MRVEYSLANTMSRVVGYADAVACVPRGDNGMVADLRLLSLVGPETVVRGFSAYLRGRGGTLNLELGKEDPEGTPWPFKAKRGLLSLDDTYRVRVRHLEYGTWHLIAVAERALRSSDDEGPVGFVAWDGDVAQSLMQRLKLTRRVPLLAEWAPAVEQSLRRGGHMQEWRVAGSAPHGGDITATSEILLDLVGGLLAKGLLVVPVGDIDAPDRAVSTVGSLDEYLGIFGPAFGRKILQESTPRHEPGGEPHPRTRELLRTPFPAQADVITAAAKTLAAGERTAWLIAEQGAGKTLMSLGVAHCYLDGKPGRILVHAPGHLVPKWEREARQTVPGVRTRVIHDWREALAAIPELRRPPQGAEVWVLARDQAKLGWFWRFGGVRRRDGTFRCPKCGDVLEKRFKDEDIPPEPWDAKYVSERRQGNLRCPSCEEPLWQADNQGPRRCAPTWLWAKRLPKGTFSLLLADEIHEEKGDSAQGRSIGWLVGLSEKSAFLTGTLLGGKSSDVFYNLARTQPARMRHYGFSYKNPLRFVRAYGLVQIRTRMRAQDVRLNASSSGSAQQSMREIPGIHPALYGDWLMGRAIFMELADIAADLPPYKEEVLPIEMAEEQKKMVRQVTSSLRDLAQQALRNHDMSVLSTYLQGALAYPDWLWTNGAIVQRSTGEELARATGEWPEDELLPKEAALLDLATSERAAGRRTAVFVEYTSTYDVAGRLTRLFRERGGLRVAHLTTKVKPQDREEWIRAATRKGADVLLCHPKLVATGLDLVGESNFPTIAWAQTGYSLFTLRQASRRSWRIGQTEPVRVVFLAYKDTLQETALQVMGEKLLAAGALEGRFSAEGLQAMAEGANAALKLAQALAEGLHDLPDLSAIWHEAAIRAPQAPPVARPRPVVVEVPRFDSGLLFSDADVADQSALVRMAKAKHRRQQETAQLSLFG